MSRRPRRANQYSFSSFSSNRARELSTTHGAWSARVVEPLAESMVSNALESAPFLRDPSYRPQLMSWARLAARADLISRWLDDHGGDLDADGEVRPAANHLVRLQRAEMQAASKLGMNPAARASLLRDVAFAGAVSTGADLDQGRALWEAAQARAATAAETEPHAAELPVDAQVQSQEEEKDSSPPVSPGQREDVDEGEAREPGQSPAPPPLDNDDVLSATEQGAALGFGPRKGTTP